MGNPISQAVKDAMQDLRESVDFRRRMDAYRHVFEKTDRIISGGSVNVVLTDPPASNLQEAPGWTDGESIFLNAQVLQRDLNALKGKDVSPLVMSLKGVNYHELAHVLFSPRIADDLCKKVVERAQGDGDFRWWYAFNSLEDQRIETWFVATYRPSYRYFESIALRWLVSHQQTVAESHLLVYGRKFLPAKVRHASRKAFVKKYGEDLATKFEDVIDRYLDVALPGDTNRAFLLIKRYRELLDEAMMVNPPDLMSDDNHPNDIPNKAQRRDDLIRKGRAGHKAQKSARNNARIFVRRAKAEDKKLREQDPGTGQSDKEGQQGQQPGQQPGGQDGDGQSDSSQGQGQGKDGTVGDGDPLDRNNIDSGGSDAPTDGGAGGGVSTTPGNSVNEQDANMPEADLSDLVNEVMDEMYDALDEALNDPDLQQDVKATADAIRAAAHGGDADVQGDRTRSTEQPVTGDMKQLVRRLVHVLERLRLDLEPTWIRRQCRGKINIRRAVFRQPHEADVFDQWDEGNEDEGGVEFVVLVDLSASMSYLADQASQALWVLKRAFDQLDVPVTVLGYSDGHFILSRPKDKAKLGTYRQFGTYNSTYPVSALREALQVFNGSKQPNQVLITITDGQWGNADEEVAPILRSMQRLGVTTVLLGLGQAVHAYGKHYHEVGHDMRQIKELPEIAVKIVASILQRVNARV